MKVLIVDDEKLSRKTLGFFLEKLGHEVLLAENGKQGFQLWQELSPRIVLTDWNMPVMDGAELCRRIRAAEGDDYTYLIMITARTDSNDLVAGFEAGVDDYLTKPVRKDELAVRLKAGERIFSLQDKDMVIFALAKLAETRDSETGFHLERIQGYSRLLAEALDRDVFPEVNRQFIETIHATSPLHDVGKVGIPDRILLKPDRLNDEEFAIIKTHTTIGFETLQSAIQKNPKAVYLRMSAEIARSHHERWDGSGYPDGLQGEAIPLAARILAVADVYDALISKRVYKEAFTHEATRSLILEGRGSHFDPRIVDTFLRVEDSVLAVARKYQE
ncbi:HD-GYP domain-containing protein [Desulfonatronum thioautotrophicum]|uniref:HD-GYP domain-containing protein n=1 Tax=Desulfonatronum thioautotrophicum TaxID=617001 RepID=UPI0005EB163E|nr:HD domain-containing phosphohydrolase [Desulfonatronum thioautotrophicum]